MKNVLFLTLLCLSIGACSKAVVKPPSSECQLKRSDIEPALALLKVAAVALPPGDTGAIYITLGALYRQGYENANTTIESAYSWLDKLCKPLPPS